MYLDGCKISILVVEGYAIVRWALRNFLAERGIAVVGEASTAEEAIDLAAIHEPDIVLMGLALNECSRLQTIRKLVIEGSRRVLGFGDCDSLESVDRFIKAGGSGFISSRSSAGEIISAITSVMEHKPWISPCISSEALPQNTCQSAIELPLSPREREVVALIAKGLSSSQIAERLFISLNTVETHRLRIFKKLGIHNRAELVEYAMDNGILYDKHVLKQRVILDAKPRR